MGRRMYIVLVNGGAVGGAPEAVSLCRTVNRGPRTRNDTRFHFRGTSAQREARARLLIVSQDREKA